MAHAQPHRLSLPDLFFLYILPAIPVFGPLLLLSSLFRIEWRNSRGEFTDLFGDVLSALCGSLLVHALYTLVLLSYVVS